MPPTPGKQPPSPPPRIRPPCDQLRTNGCCCQVDTPPHSYPAIPSHSRRTPPLPPLTHILTTPPSFPRKRESTPPLPTLTDTTPLHIPPFPSLPHFPHSRESGNPHPAATPAVPHPPALRQAQGERMLPPGQPTPAHRHPRPYLTSLPHRHSRESGNPHHHHSRSAPHHPHPYPVIPAKAGNRPNCQPRRRQAVRASSSWPRCGRRRGAAGAWGRGAKPNRRRARSTSDNTLLV